MPLMIRSFQPSLCVVSAGYLGSCLRATLTGVAGGIAEPMRRANQAYFVAAFDEVVEESLLPPAATETSWPNESS